MKTIILSLVAAVALAIPSLSQTNIYITNLKTNAKSSVAGCGPRYFYVSTAVWRTTESTNKSPWFSMGTNTVTANMTNPAVLLQIVGHSGGGVCGHGTLVYTDPNWNQVNHEVSFNAWMTSSIPWSLDTNNPRGIYVTGTTNIP